MLRTPETRRRRAAVASIVAAMATVLSTGGPGSAARAQQPQAPSAAGDLRPSLDSLERELAAERAYAVEREKKQAAEVAALEAERSALAARLLAAQAERERNVAELERLKNEATAIGAAADALAVQAGSIRPILREATDQLRLLLEETPGSEGAVKRLAELSLKFGKKDAASDREALVGAAGALVELMDQTHARAGRVTLENAKIFTAKDESEEVQLLSLGLARFAYLTRDGRRAGLALSSPSEAAGYRWSEDLPPFRSTLWAGSSRGRSIGRNRFTTRFGWAAR
jgi:hypothetical protein